MHRHRRPDPLSKRLDVGPVTDADDADLADLRRWVIEPAVRAVLRDDELDELVVHRGAEPRPEVVMVGVVARGELFGFYVNDAEGSTETLDEVAARLVGDLEDFVSTTDVAWGERRTARPYELWQE